MPSLLGAELKGNIGLAFLRGSYPDAESDISGSTLRAGGSEQEVLPASSRT